MADPTPNTPATPAPSPAVAKAFAPPDALVRLDVYGREQFVPVSELARDAQKYMAGEQKLAEAKQLLALARGDEEYARRMRALDGDMRADPERTLKSLARQYGAAYNPDGTEQSHGSEAGQQPESTNTRALEQRLQKLESTQTRVQIEQQTEAVLDRYQLFKADQFSRDGARLVMLAARTVDGGADIEAVAREYHSQRVRELGAQATAVRDNREAAAGSVVNVPANIGTPDLAAIPSGKATGFRDGTLKSNIAAGLQAFRRATGLAPGT